MLYLVKYTKTLSSAEKQAMEKIVYAFLEENTKVNLSSIRDKDGVWKKHILDSISSREMLQEILKESESVLDFGTGGGFPLLPLAVLFPQNTFYGLDSVGKKTRAIESIAQNCNISNVQTLAGRGEAFAHDKQYREQFQIALSRAAAPWNVLLEILLPFVQVGGYLISYRGPESEETDADFARHMGAKLITVQKYELPDGEKRTLWLLQKTKKTPKHFPREVGIPKKKPLGIKDIY